MCNALTPPASVRAGSTRIARAGRSAPRRAAPRARMTTTTPPNVEGSSAVMPNRSESTRAPAPREQQADDHADRDDLQAFDDDHAADRRRRGAERQPDPELAPALTDRIRDHAEQAGRRPARARAPRNPTNSALMIRELASSSSMIGLIVFSSEIATIGSSRAHHRLDVCRAARQDRRIARMPSTAARATDRSARRSADSRASPALSRVSVTTPTIVDRLIAARRRPES